MNESRINNLEWVCIRNAKRVLDVIRAKKLPVIQIKEVHRPDITVDDVEAHCKQYAAKPAEPVNGKMNGLPYPKSQRAAQRAGNQ